MNFDFNIGQDEKHNIRFIYSKIWGTKTIMVDNQTVKRRILPFILNFSGVILIIAFLLFRLVQWPDYQSNLLEIYMFVIILGCIDSAIGLLPMTVIVGEKKKYVVKIQFVWKPFPFYRSSKFKVYLNDYYFKTFEGERLIESVDEKIVFQKH